MVYPDFLEACTAKRFNHVTVGSSCSIAISRPIRLSQMHEKMDQRQRTFSTITTVVAAVAIITVNEMLMARYVVFCVRAIGEVVHLTLDIVVLEELSAFCSMERNAFASGCVNECEPGRKVTKKVCSNVGNMSLICAR
jgi:hypothetical protein